MLVPTEPTTSHRPCLVLAHADPTFATEACRSFRRLGWDVYQGRSGPEVRRLGRMMEADLIILGVDLFEESGWLTCAKVSGELPLTRVILVGDGPDPRAEELAHFAGARAFVLRQDGIPALARAALDGPPLSAAG